MNGVLIVNYQSNPWGWDSATFDLLEHVFWSELSWNPILQLHTNPPSVLLQWYWQSCMPVKHSLTSMQAAPSRPKEYPRGHPQVNEPCVLLQFCWQLCTPSTHSSMSRHVFPSLESVYPALQLQWNDPMVLVQICWQLFVPLVHSLISRQESSSLESVNPRLQLHWKDPTVLLQIWSQLPLLRAHSLTSVELSTTMINIFKWHILLWFYQSKFFHQHWVCIQCCSHTELVLMHWSD